MLTIDHTNTNLNKIHAYWRPGESADFALRAQSHGSRINSGIFKLEQLDPKYDVAIRSGGLVACPTGRARSASTTATTTPIATGTTLRLNYWADADGISHTQSVATTGWFNYSMWAWCGQQSDNSTATVQEYLDTLNTFESQYPAMRFILMTGHTDGSGSDGTLYRNNNLVLQLCGATARSSSISPTSRATIRPGTITPTPTKVAPGATTGARRIPRIARTCPIPARTRIPSTAS